MKLIKRLLVLTKEINRQIRSNTPKEEAKHKLTMLNDPKEVKESWTPFSTSKKEIEEMLVSMGQVIVGDDFLKIENYPFEPSIAFKQTIFKPHEIDEIDFKSYLPTIRIKDELIFLPSEKRSELENLGKRNKINIVERLGIWNAILEPFLDTEFTNEAGKRTSQFLENYGLTNEQVKTLRKEVELQMLKYNFDTTLWEWVDLNASDVLRAMMPKYNKEEFKNFYEQVMTIALLPKKSDQ